MSLSKLSNGTTKAGRLQCSDSMVNFRSKPKFLATIDFGTTHCSVVYLVNAHLHVDPGEIEPNIVKLDDKHSRVPSCILFDQHGNFVDFGYNAREMYSKMDKEVRPTFIYFEHIKKHLQHDETVDRDFKISALNGNSFFLVDVIAHVLHYLKDQVVTEVKEFVNPSVEASDFDWVITVPAIWKGKGKQMMREAGYRAGLCSSETPPPLQQTTLLIPKEEKSPDRLSLALEPESAAIHCKRKAKEEGQSTQSLIAKNYLVVDIGGGTVDIATHALIGEHIEEIAPPAGNFWGGTTVNERFEHFLVKFLDDTDFSRYTKKGTAVEMARHKADLNKLLFQTFELEKQNFGNDNAKRKNYVIEFPLTFLNVYRKKLTEMGKEVASKNEKSDVLIEDEGACMRLYPSKMEEFFRPTLNGIATLIEDHLQPQLVGVIDTIYWVGGFGGSKYLRRKLQERLAKLKKFHFAVPPQPELAVIRGATAFRCDPGIVGKRRADATYGLSCSFPFDDSLHRPDYKFWNEDHKEYYCNHIFLTFVEKGETICSNEVFSTDYVPSSRNMKRLTINILSSPSHNVRYTTDDGVYELGKISVDVGGSGLDRNIELLFDITHTEIQVRARDVKGGHESKVVVDFLSASDKK